MKKLRLAALAALALTFGSLWHACGPGPYAVDAPQTVAAP